MKLIIDPIYGYGWLVAGRSRREVPAQFVVEIDGHSAAGQDTPAEWRGKIVMPGHEFDGADITMQQRHRTWSGHVNVFIGKMENGAASIASGNAMVADHERISA